MGLDMFIIARKNVGTPNEESRELVYWRKYWDLRNFMLFQDDEVCRSPGLRIDKPMLEKMIKYYTENPDYNYDAPGKETLFSDIEEASGFSQLTKLCYILKNYDTLINEGWQLYYIDSY